MLNIREQINSLKKKIKNKIVTSDYVKQGVNPSKDWIVMVYVFFTVFIIMSVWSYFLYTSISDGSFWSSRATDTSSKVYSIDQKKLKLVNDYFTQKDVNFKKGPKPTIDPSL
jgi:hypothetical protein